jgi:hypothetical protein
VRPDVVAFCVHAVYQHCSEKHLHRYLAEFDFRYSNRSKLGVDDDQRTARVVKGIVGKRLTYRAADHWVAVWQEQRRAKETPEKDW